MKKKLGLLVGITSVLFILGSCGNSPQDEFVSYMEKQQKQTEGTYDFKMAIEELEMATSPETAANPMIGMLATQLKDMSLTGTMKANLKEDNAFSVDMKVNALGMEVPFSMMGSFGKNPKMYMATDMMQYIMGIVSSMTGIDMTAEADYTQLEGKFVDVLSMNEASDQGSWDDLIKEIEASQKNQEDINKKYIKFIKQLDKKAFSKKDDVITHTLSEKEIIELLKEISQDSTTDIKELETLFKDFDKMNMTIAINTKKDHTSLTMDMAPKKEQAATAGFSSIKLLFETTLTDRKANITFPNKEDILTEKQMEEFFPQTPATDSAITDDEFTELLDALKENKDSISEEDKETLLTTYQEFLTAEQYKTLEETLK